MTILRGLGTIAAVRRDPGGWRQIISSRIARIKSRMTRKAVIGFAGCKMGIDLFGRRRARKHRPFSQVRRPPREVFSP
jgi:hypothetical protein